MSTDKIVSLDSYRKTREARESLARGRTPVFSTYNPAKSDDKNPSRPSPSGLTSSSSFEARICRIRKKIEKINTLMRDLKKKPKTPPYHRV